MNKWVGVLNRSLIEGMSRCLEIGKIDTLFLAELHQQAIVSTVMPNSLTNLRCLVLEKRWSYTELADDKIKVFLGAVLKQLDSLEQLVIPFATRDKTQPHQNTK